MFILSVTLLLVPTTAHSAIFRDALGKFHSSEWRVDLPSEVSGLSMAGDCATLTNRAVLSPHVLAESGARVAFDWRYEADPRLADAAKTQNDPELQRRYVDTITVVLHTDGALKESRSWEAKNGIKAVLNAGYGEISVLDGDEKLAESYCMTVGDSRVVTDKSSSSTPAIEPNTWYRVVVAHLDGKVTVSLQGPGNDEPVEVLSTEISPRNMKGSRILIYNREANAGATMRSQIRNVAIMY